MLFLKNSKSGIDDRGHRLRSGSPVTNLPGAARGKFVSGAKVLAAVPRIWQPGSFISNFR